jgi:hypothetical protein
MRRHGADNFYSILEVSPRAGAEEIREAYKRLARRWHPDRNPGDHHAEEQIKLINEAYAVLRDPLRRRLHDVLLAQGADVRAAGRASERMRPPGGTQRADHPVDARAAGWGPSRLRLLPWELVAIRWLLLSSTWLFTRLHVQLMSGWFWLGLMAAGAALFLLMWPASLAVVILLILLAGALQASLLIYIYVRIKLGPRPGR